MGQDLSGCGLLRLVRRRSGVRALVLAAALVAMAGCASSPRAATPELDRSGTMPQQVQGVSGAMTTIRMADNVTAKSNIIDLAPATAFAALKNAYATLGIPVTDINDTKRTIGNVAFRTRKKVGDVPMTKVVDCGGDSGMPNAETYQITLSVQSVISPNDAGGSVLQTLVEGSAKNPLTSASSGVVRCVSVGGLEDQVAKLVRGR